MDDFSDLLPRFDLRGMDLQLDRMQAALQELANPAATIPAIQVVGTNGKGSIVRFLESALCTSGISCGVTTSPHLVSWCERIRINETAISTHALRKLLVDLQGVSQRHKLTPFELLITASLVAFEQESPDLLLLEVGLGGRLDATTAHPRRPVIAMASIGLDHCEHLGSTLSAIAAEKAAAIPKHATVISADQEPAVRAVLEETCREQQANLHWVNPLPDDWQLGLMGNIQRSNAAVALGALQALEPLGWRISDADIRTGFQRARWPGRLQTVRWRGHPLRLDGAHNPPAARQLACERHNWPGAEHGVTWILAIQAHKDAVAMLNALVEPNDQVWVVPVPGHTSWSREALVNAMPARASQLKRADNVAAVLGALSLESSWPKPMPTVAGSLYLIGDLFSRSVVRAE